jgi:hypothetical protein
MTTTTDIGGDREIVRRALTAIEMRRAQLTPLMLRYLSATFFILIITGACLSEFWSAGVGFHAAFPEKSDGTSLASELLSLRYPIIFCLLAGDVVLNVVPNRLKAVLDGLTHSIAIGAILALLFGVGSFMLCATMLTLDSDGGQGFAGHLVGLSLAIASASMFTLSFTASHAVMGKLFAVLPVIAAGRAERARIAADEALVGELEARRARIEGLRDAIAEMEKPDTLARRAANEAGVIVGMVAAEAYDLAASRRMRGDRIVEPQDHCEVPDVPVDALEQRYADLAPYTADYFFNLLKQKEA